MKTFDDVLNNFITDKLLSMLVCYGRYLGYDNIALFAHSSEHAEMIHDRFVSGGDIPNQIEYFFLQADWYPIAFGETAAEAFNNLKEKVVTLYNKHLQEGTLDDWRTAVQIASSSLFSEYEKSKYAPDKRLTNNYRDCL